MKKAMIILILVLICFTSASADSGVWVEETWGQIDREIDCEGLPLLIHAKVLEVPEGTEVCEYHLEKLSREAVVEKGKQIDWEALGFDTSSGEWKMPTKSDPVYLFVSEPSSFPMCHLYQYCNVNLATLDPYYMYENSMHEDYIDDPNQFEINGVSREEIIRDAELVATEFGFQLGDVLRVNKCDDPETISERMKSYIKRMGWSESYYPKEAADYTFTDLTFPVYYNGLRLFSGRWTSLENNLEVPNMNMRMIVTPGYGISEVESMLFSGRQLKAISEYKPAINVDEAIHCIEEKYANMFFPGVKSVTVLSMALEYVTITGDWASDKPYTLYPAWVTQISIMDEESDDPYITYEAYDSVTGKPLF